MNKKYLLIALLCLAFVGCKNKPVSSKSKGDVVVKVGRSVLTTTQFYSFIPPEYTATLTPSQKKQLAEMWINTELLYQEALSQKLDKEEKMATKLHEMERQMLANQLLETKLANMGSVEEAGVRNYFEQNKDRFNTERKFAEIIVNSEDEAKGIMDRINNGEKFENLAKAYSLAPSAKDGGVSGYVRIGDLQFPEIESIVFSMDKLDGITGPVPTKYGYVIVKLLGIQKTSKEVTYENVKEGIRATLNYNRQKTALDSLLAGLKKTYKVEEHYEILGAQ
jgi:peptidyl-prolyl cis-trans isomerase C